MNTMENAKVRYSVWLSLRDEQSHITGIQDARNVKPVDNLVGRQSDLAGLNCDVVLSALIVKLFLNWIEREWNETFLPSLLLFNDTILCVQNPTEVEAEMLSAPHLKFS